MPSASKNSDGSKPLVARVDERIEKVSRTAAAKLVIDRMARLRPPPELPSTVVPSLFGLGIFSIAWWLLPAGVWMLVLLATVTGASLFLYGLEAIAHHGDRSEAIRELVNTTGWEEESIVAAANAARRQLGAPAVQEALLLRRAPRVEELPAPDMDAERRRDKRERTKAPAPQPWRR